MTTIWERIEATIKSDVAIIEADLTPAFKAVMNFLKTLAEDEITAAIPILEKYVTTVFTDPGAFFSPSQWPNLIQSLITEAAPDLEASAIRIAGPEIMTAASAVVSAAASRVTAAATAALAPTP